jgi:hypothetical protein
MSGLRVRFLDGAWEIVVRAFTVVEKKQSKSSSLASRCECVNNCCGICRV